MRDYDKYTPAERRKRDLLRLELQASGAIGWVPAVDPAKVEPIFVDRSEPKPVTRKCPEAPPDHREEPADGCQEKSEKSVDAGVSDTCVSLENGNDYCVFEGCRICKILRRQRWLREVRLGRGSEPPPAREET